MASSHSASSLSPRGAPCRCWVLGWAWAAARRLPGGVCAMSRPGRCSSTWSARRWSHARPLGSPGFQQNSWDLQSAEDNQEGGGKQSFSQNLSHLYLLVTCDLTFVPNGKNGTILGIVRMKGDADLDLPFLISNYPKRIFEIFSEI